MAKDKTDVSETTQEADAVSSKTLAEKPEISEVFKRVMEGETEDSRPDTQSKPKASRKKKAEEIESLASLEDADNLDDLGGSQEDEGEKGGKADKDVKDTEDKTADDAGEEGKGKDTDSDKSDSVTLNPILRHAAKRAGWSDDEIDGLANSDPDLADRTLKRLADTYNDLTVQYARLGQIKKEDHRRSEGSFKETVKQKDRDEDFDFLAQIYGEEQLEEFGETYDKDFVKKVLGPLTRELKGVYQHYQRASQDTVLGEIRQFFKTLPKEFSDFYGEPGKISPDQMKHRDSLGVLADQIRAGSLMQGQDMTIGESLERANMLFAAEQIGKIERKRITDQVKKRSKQISHRPTQRDSKNVSAQKSGEKSVSGAMEAYSQRAIELGVELSA